MKIERGSMSIELSEYELRAAHDEYESECHYEDVRNVLETDFDDAEYVAKGINEITKDAELMEKLKRRYEQYLGNSEDWFNCAKNAIRDCLNDEGLILE